MTTKIQGRSDQIYAQHQQQIYKQTDRMFAVLMVVQWLGGIIAALIISPRTWIGQASQVHLHVWAAVVLGGVISIFPILLAVFRPGHVLTRYTIAVGQMLMSSLLIHLSGGRIETHFHVFGSLAFLSFYRDWRVLVPATVVVAVDHMVRGVFYPQSVFGVLGADNWRWVEHAAWVIFEDIFLVLSCLRGQAEMRQIADHTARLNTSEARYRSVTDSASEAIITMDNSGTILFANRTAALIFGYGPDELPGREIVELVPPAMRKKQAARLRRLGNGTQSVSGQVIEIAAMHKAGREFLTETSFADYETNEGRVFTVVARDITERKLAEMALKESEEYRNLFQHANDSILIFSPADQVVLDVNDKACEVYGLTRENFIGRSLKEFSRDVARTERHVEELLAMGSSTSFETTSVRADGTAIELLINASVIERDGEPAILSINRDISDRKRAKDALEHNLSLLSSTFEATADGILAVDLTNQIIAANEKFIEMWDIPKEVGDLSASTETVSAHVLGQVTDPDGFASLMTRSLNEPDEISASIIELKNGRIFERYTQPQILDGKTVGRVMSFRDITDQKRAEQTLKDSETRYRLLFEGNPYPIWVYDTESLEFLAVNEAAIDQYGYSREEFLKLTIKDIRPPEDVPQLLEFLDTARNNEEVGRAVRHQRKDGTILDVEVAAQTIFYGGRLARIGLVTDMTDRKRADSALRESEYRIRTLLDSMSEGLLQVDSDDLVLYVNNCICEMTGYSQKELIGSDWSRLLVDNGPEFVKAINDRRLNGISDRYELRLRKKSGEIIWVIIGGAPIIDANGAVVGSMGVFTDITERKRAEEQLLHDALHDGLTGLANRTLFMDHLRMAIERGKNRHSNPFAVLYLDLDRFKVINDSLGHTEGDKLLKYTARRLEKCTRSGDLVARLGGDEFVILLNELADTDEALLVTERIQDDLRNSFDLGGRQIFTTASIGVTLSTSGHTSADDLIRDADIAMYCAKAKGKAQYQIFDQAMHRHASKKLQIETELRTAVERNQFRIHYQPIIQLDTGGLVGFEALLRWCHPERGIIPPDEFIPIAEENGMIIQLGHWAVQESCRQLREWQTSEPLARDLTVSVNLSCKEFLQMDLAEQVSAALKTTNLDPRSLKLEITESHIMENSERAIMILNRLRKLGIEMSLDDFGTGYSSLSYLHRLPVTFLKIDRSFVSRMVKSDENREIVDTIVRLAQNLKMKVIAEGIETVEQVSQLAGLSCEFGQGYYFSKPLEADAAKQFIIDGSGRQRFVVQNVNELELTM